MSFCYKVVTDMEVLKEYYDFMSDLNKHGLWCEYVSIEKMARILNTSKYQITKAYKSLKNNGYMELTRVCTYAEEYDNGLFTTGFPILFCTVYTITAKGKEILKERK